jgi:SAM-dependent methyltransferase
MRKVRREITNNFKAGKSLKEYDRIAYECVDDDVWVTTEIPMDKEFNPKAIKNDDFKQQLRTAYDADAERRVTGGDSREVWKLDARTNFASLAKQEGKKTILEIGAGAGHDSAYFQSQGFEVLATDLSPQMVEACKRNGVKAQVLDLYELASLGRKFDAIYSLNVLLHVPREDLRRVLHGIHEALTPNGLFFYGVYSGVEKEETFTDPSKMNLPRFFSFLADDTLEEVASEEFDIIDSKAISFEKYKDGLHFLSLLLRKK